MDGDKRAADVFISWYCKSVGDICMHDNASSTYIYTIVCIYIYYIACKRLPSSLTAVLKVKHKN